MNKINICENFKNENLPLIFNINYEGFSKYNKNETYINIYNRFFIILTKTLIINIKY